MPIYDPQTFTIRPDDANGAKTAYVTPEDFEATEFEFYIPEAIAEHPATVAFVKWIETLEPSATIFKGLLGMWEGKPEQSSIYRMVLRNDRMSGPGVIPAIVNEVSKLTAQLAEQAASRQEMVFFTTRQVTGYAHWLVQIK